MAQFGPIGNDELFSPHPEMRPFVVFAYRLGVTASDSNAGFSTPPDSEAVLIRSKCR